MSRPCVFFDRDGVVNRSPGDGRYVLNVSEFHLMEGLRDLLRTIGSAGFATVVVTSQRGVGRGLMSREDLEEIHQHLQSELRSEGIPFLDIYACTHVESDRHWAKPSPEMILEAAKKHDLDLAHSMIIGDADRDIQMGINAGLGVTIRLRGEKPIGISADYTCDNLLEINELFHRLLPSAND